MAYGPLGQPRWSSAHLRIGYLSHAISGMDKSSHTERLRYVADNLDVFFDCALKPLSGTVRISSYSSKHSFLYYFGVESVDGEGRPMAIPRSVH